MERKHFQRDYPMDSVSVDFVIEYQGTQGIITTIQLNTSKGLLPLPQKPTIGTKDGEWVLFENSIEKIDGKDIHTLTPVINEYTIDIVNEILRMKEDESSIGGGKLDNWEAD